jgi:hypothetical protein
VRKHSLNARRILRSILLLATLFCLSSLLFDSASASVYSSPLFQPYATIAAPPVVLNSGTAGSSTIYTNGTSAKVSVSAPVTQAYGVNWLIGWTYRKQHNITSAIRAGTGYDVLITIINGTGTDSGKTVYVNNKTKPDFSDVRFTASDGSTLLNHWQDDYLLYSQKNSTFWFQDTDNLTSTGSTIYVYYGNSGASSISNGTNTFLFFDDFSGTLSRWTVETGTWSITSGYLRQTGVGTLATIRVTSGNWTSIVMEDYWRCTSGACDSGPLVSWQGSNTGYYLERAASVFTLYKEPAGTPVLTNSSLSAPGTAWHTFTAIVNGTAANSMNITFYDDGALDASYRRGAWVNGTVGLATWPGGSANPNVNFDDVKVRKYTYPEPAQGAWGTEQSDTVLNVVNQVTGAWNVSLQAYGSSNIVRLSNAIIGLHDATTSSDQIIVSSGSVTQSQGALFNLPGGSGSTVYISMSNLLANATGSSYLYVHLKILTPNTTTYLLYVITFEIT